MCLRVLCVRVRVCMGVCVRMRALIHIPLVSFASLRTHTGANVPQGPQQYAVVISGNIGECAAGAKSCPRACSGQGLCDSATGKVCFIPPLSTECMPNYTIRIYMLTRIHTRISARAPSRARACFGHGLCKCVFFLNKSAQSKIYAQTYTSFLTFLLF